MVNYSDRRIVGLYSNYPQAGKSSAASWLCKLGFKQYSFAAPIRRMIATLLRQVGLVEPEISRLLYEGKIEPIEQLPGAPTVRYLMQTVGTKWGREMVHPDLWVEIARAKINAVDRRWSFVLDDLRFPNEWDLIREEDGAIVRIERVGYAPVDEIAEGELRDRTPDAVILAANLKELYAQLNEMFADVKGLLANKNMPED